MFGLLITSHISNLKNLLTDEKTKRNIVSVVCYNLNNKFSFSSIFSFDFIFYLIGEYIL